MSETRDIISIADIKAIRIQCPGENCTAEQLFTPTRFDWTNLQRPCPECGAIRSNRLTSDSFDYSEVALCEAIKALQLREATQIPKGENHQSTIRFEVIPPHTRG